MYIMNRPNYGTKTAGGNSRIYNCQVCDRAFTREEHLTRHTQSTHNKLKPFCCGICSRPFSRRDLLLRHAKNLHQGSELAVSRIRRLYKRTGPGGDSHSPTGTDPNMLGEEYSPDNSPSYNSPTSPDLAPTHAMAAADPSSSMIPHLAYKQSTAVFQPSASTLLAAAAASSASDGSVVGMGSQPSMRGRSVSNPTTLSPLLGLPLHAGHRHHSNHEIQTSMSNNYNDSTNSSNSATSSNSTGSNYSNYPKSSAFPHHHHQSHNTNSYNSTTIPPLFPSTYTTAPKLLSPVLPSPLPNINSHSQLHVKESPPQNNLVGVAPTSPNENGEAEEQDGSPSKKGKKKQKMSVQMLVS